MDVNNRAPFVDPEKQEKCTIAKPAKEVLMGTDNLNNKLFRKMRNMTNTAMEKVLMQGCPTQIVESETQKINGEYQKVEAITKFWFEVVEGCDLTKIAKLTPEDQWVLGACMAEIQKGNRQTTAEIIFRDCGGIGDPSPKKVEEILKSVDKMMSLKIHIDATDVKKKLYQMRHKYGDDFTVDVVDVILPCYYQLTRLNGVPNTLTIKFRDVSPLFKYAIAKGQVTVLPTKLLAVPKRKNTPHFLELKGYILTRIQAIKRTRKRNNQFPTVLLMDTLLEHCGFKDDIGSRMFRKRIWEDVMLYLEFLVDENVISSFQGYDEKGKPIDKWDKNGKIMFTYVLNSNDYPSE